MANGMPLLFSLLTVKFHIGGRKTLKQVTGRQVAYPQPGEFLYSIGKIYYSYSQMGFGRHGSGLCEN